MLYVPIVVPQHRPPSPRTRELADRLARTIHDFEQKHPTTTRAEVRRATQLALQSSAGGSDLAPVAAVLGGLVALGVGVFLFFEPAGGGSGIAVEGLPLTAIALGLGIVAVLAIKLGRRP